MKGKQKDMAVELFLERLGFPADYILNKISVSESGTMVRVTANKVEK